MNAVDQFQGDPVRITRRAHDQIRRAEAERIERVCAALRDIPGLTDDAARMYARTILTSYSPGPTPSQRASDPTPTTSRRINPFRRGKKP
jgi:sulfite reductase beta subunit-like hemoprotein